MISQLCANNGLADALVQLASALHAAPRPTYPELRRGVAPADQAKARRDMGLRLSRVQDVSAFADP